MNPEQMNDEDWNNLLLQEEMEWRRKEEFWEYRKEMLEQLKDKDGE